MPIVRRSVKEIRKHAGRVDWERVRHTTDREIAAQIATGATPFRWTVLGLRLDFLFAESFRS